MSLNNKIVVSKTQMTVTRNGVKVPQIAKLEFDLLYYLAVHKGKALSRTELTNSVWEGFVIDRTVDVHINKLRKKLSTNPQDSKNNDLIETITGVGYKLIGDVTVDDVIDDQSDAEKKDGIVIGGIYKNSHNQHVCVLNIAESKHGNMAVFIKGSVWSCLTTKEFNVVFRLVK